MKRWTPDPTLLGGMRATVHGTFIDHHDFRQALAEKDEKIERLKQEAQIHAQEARTANRTIAEIYQVVSGATGEPGNWHGAEPVKQLMAQAMLFAECLSDQCGKCRGYEQSDCTMLKAQAFLKEQQS